MEKVLGLGGVFFKPRDPQKLAAWYAEHLGVPIEGASPYGTFMSGEPGEMTVWATFPANTEYFGSGPQHSMINYRVANLEAMLAQLRVAGAQVDDNIQDEGYGRFGWATDPEGNRFELWEPSSEPDTAA